MPSFPCSAQKSAVLVPSTPYAGCCLSQSGWPHLWLSAQASAVLLPSMPYDGCLTLGDTGCRGVQLQLPQKFTGLSICHGTHTLLAWLRALVFALPGPLWCVWNVARIGSPARKCDMVRKKMKKAASGGSGTNNSIAQNDITGIVRSWLKDLDLVDHELIPAVPSDLDIFSLVRPAGETSAFAQARGLQALRAGVVANTIVRAEDLRLIFLVSLLLFIHPETSHLRKAVKSLLAATENSAKEQQCGSSDTDGMVELVAARFAARSWHMHNGAPAEAGGSLRLAASL